MDFNEFIRPELLVLVPVLYLIGMGIKKSAAKDKWIPVVLGIAGVVLASAYLMVFPSDLNIGQSIVTGAIQGILCAGMAVYSNQIVKQAGETDAEE